MKEYIYTEDQDSIEGSVKFSLNEFYTIFDVKGVQFFAEVDGKIISVKKLFAEVTIRDDGYVSEDFLKMCKEVSND